MSFLKARANRATYWLSLATIVAISAALGMVLDHRPKASFGVLIILFVFRLHDIGRTGWWALAPLAIQFGLAIGFMSLNLMGLGIVLSAFFTVAFIIALGAIPGQPGANRFGEPPLPGLKSAFKFQRS